MLDDPRRPSVLFVREWEAQLSSSGCCGRLEGELLTAEPGDGRVFEKRRSDMECAGDLYRAVRDRYGDRVDVRVVDPRNLVVLIPTLVREALSRSMSLSELLRTIVGLSVNTLIVNGRIVAKDEWPDPGGLLQLLDRELEAASEGEPAPAASG